MRTLRRLWNWFVDRSALDTVWELFRGHRVVPDAASNKSGWLYVFGIATLVAFLIQVVTGVALATKYIPSPDFAWDSLVYITDEVWLGGFLRGVHFYGASAMVLLALIHMARVFLTASYKYPRELNWITGVVLLVLIMVMAFTGQLLRWNQDGLWSVMVASQYAGYAPFIGEPLKEFVLGGSDVGGVTLSRFYAFHILWVPLMIAAVVGLHLYLVFQQGISELPREGEPVDPATYRERHRALIEREGRSYLPDAAWQEAVTGAAVVGAVIALALVFGPVPPGEPPDPTIVPQLSRPDWFLVWYYALISVKPRGTEEQFMVYLPLAALILLILLPLFFNAGERSLRRRPWAVAIVGVTVIFFGTLTWLGYRAPWVPDFDTRPLDAATLDAATRGATFDAGARGTTLGVDAAVLEGARIFYLKGCQYCHAVLGEGGRYGPELTDVAARLPPEEITVRILNGIGNMPAYRDGITQEEVTMLLVFLRSLSEE